VIVTLSLQLVCYLRRPLASASCFSYCLPLVQSDRTCTLAA